MEKLITNKLTIERSGIFDKNLKKRFELTFECKGVKEKKTILVIGLNPASASRSTDGRLCKADVLVNYRIRVFF